MRTVPLSFRLLAGVTRRLPPLPHVSGMGNRIARPLFCRWHKGSIRVNVWPHIDMILDPTDAMAGYLAFVPQLYDRWERKIVADHLPHGGTFVDVGANLGAYTLWAANLVGNEGRVVAFEATPRNFAALTKNVEINGFKQISTFQVGVSDRDELLELFINPINCGICYFRTVGHPYRLEESVMVECKPLATLLSRAGVDQIDFLKIDVENFEHRIFVRFFDDVPKTSTLRPRYILSELFGGEENPVKELLERNGYRMQEFRNGNGFFAA